MQKPWLHLKSVCSKARCAPRNGRCCSRSFGRAFGLRSRSPVCLFFCRLLRFGSICRREVHFGLLCAFGAALFLSLLPLVIWRRPSRAASFERLEQASALDHRPLTAFNDTLTQDNAAPETMALWQAHRVRASRALRKLKAGAPHPRIDRYDPFALRAALVLMLAAVVSWSGSDLTGRVKAAFAVPEMTGGAGFRIDAWISPPAYTRKEPFVLPDNPQSATAVPQGSLLTVKVNGPGAPTYRVALKNGERIQVLDPTGQSSGSYAEYTQKIERSGTLTVRHGFGSERSWMLTAIPDRAPTITFLGPVEVSPRGVMLFKYKVDDDYGVATAEAHVERIPLPANASSGGEAPQQIGKPPVFPLPLPRSPVKSAEAKTYRDLTAHPWPACRPSSRLSPRTRPATKAVARRAGLSFPSANSQNHLRRRSSDKDARLSKIPAIPSGLPTTSTRSPSAPRMTISLLPST